jgi:hypothetical protein
MAVRFVALLTDPAGQETFIRPAGIPPLASATFERYPRPAISHALLNRWLFPVERRCSSIWGRIITVSRHSDDQFEQAFALIGPDGLFVGPPFQQKRRTL